MIRVPALSYSRRLHLGLWLAALASFPPAAVLAQVPRADAVRTGTFRAGWQRGTTATVSGDLTVVFADDLANHRADRLYFVRDEHSGRVVQVQFEKPPKGLRTGSVVSLTGRESDSQLYVLASLTDATSTTSAIVTPVASSVSPPQDDPTAGHRTLVMVGNFTDTCVSCTTNAIADAVFADPGGLSVTALYEASSLGQVRLSGEVAGPYTIPFSSTGTCDIGAWAKALADQAVAAGIDLAGYQKRVYVLPAAACGAAGYATVGGTPSAAWVFQCDLKGLFAHELGHNLGLDHAGTPASEYDDATDPMAFSGRPLRGVNAPHRDQMRWVAAGAVQPITQPGLYDLAPLALDPVPAGTVQVLKVAKPDTGDYYYLSYRQPIGFDRYIDGSYYDRLSVHRYKGDGSSSLTYVLARLADGERFVDAANGLTFSLVSHTATAATVSIELACVPSPPSLLLAPGTQAAPAGGTLTYTATLANLDSPTCAPSAYSLTSSAPGGWAATVLPGSVSLTPGGNAQLVFSVTSPVDARAGAVTVGLSANDASLALHSVTATATYTVSDTLAPSAPTALKAAVNQKRKQIQLSWTAATDNVGVVGYRVWKNGVLAATSPTTTWVDPVYASGAYTVTAHDAAGNVSVQSNVAEVALSGGRKR